MSEDITGTLCRYIRGGLLVAGLATALLHAEPNSTLTGRVIDLSDRVVPGAEILVRNLATLVERTVTSNADGIYEIAALPVGVYRMQVLARGFRPYSVEALTTQVSRILMEDIRLQLGDFSQVFVVSRTLTHDKAFESIAREELQCNQNEIAIHYLTDLSLEELTARVKDLPRDFVIIYVWQQLRDRRGNVLESPDVLSVIAGQANVPIYGMSATDVGLGIIGGHVYTQEGNVTKLAEITLRVAGGVTTQDIPVEKAPETPMFDWRQLRRWNMDEDLLPPGSVIQFSELTMWRQYVKAEAANLRHVIGLEPGQPDYRILIVDHRESWLLLLRLLQTVGFNVHVVEDGERAVEAFQAWRPHFIWMDIRLPVMSGLEAARRIRQIEGDVRDVKIVAATAPAFSSQREEVLKSGFDDFLRKSYRPREIFDCMSYQLGQICIRSGAGRACRGSAGHIKAAGLREPSGSAAGRTGRCRGLTRR